MPFYSLPSGASPVLAGSSPPTGGVGQVGDLFIDTTNAVLYGPKTISGWATGINLSLGPTGAASTVPGPTGPTGPRVTGPAGPASTVTGPTGPSGAAGQAGATGGYAFAATGATAPNLVTPGAIWLDTSSGKYYVRYESQFIEIGVQGQAGPTGPQGSGSTGPTGPTGSASTVTGPAGAAGVFPFDATGATAPAGVVPGSVWLDTSSGKYYVRYESQFIEIGVQGEAGATGPAGAASTVPGPTGPGGSGPTGPAGAASTVTGPTGPQGAGPTGPTGTAGAASTVPGPTGPTGPGGAASTVPGPTGPTGPRVTGPTGPAGSTTGPTGPTGGYGLPQQINAQTDTYTLVAADAGRLITINSGSSKSLIIPPASSVAFPTGTHIDVARLGDGALTVTGGAGVTVHATPGQKLRARYSGASMVLYAGDTWLVVGDLSS